MATIKITDYDKIVFWVEDNFLDVRVYGKHDGKDIGQGITVNWRVKKNQASYLSCTDNEGKISKKIIVWDFDKISYKTFALLHELGHHTECQNGDPVYKERKAWEGCFKWMHHLGISVTEDLLLQASKWFSSYLTEYGLNGDDKVWLDKYGMHYIPEIKDDYIRYLEDLNDIEPIATKFNLKGKLSKSFDKRKIFGRESWRKHWRD